MSFAAEEALGGAAEKERMRWPCSTWHTSSRLPWPSTSFSDETEEEIESERSTYGIDARLSPAPSSRNGCEDDPLGRPSSRLGI